MKLDDGSDNGVQSPRLGAIGEFGLTTTLVGVNAWIAAGSFESLARDGQPIEYMLVSPSFAALAMLLATAGVVLAALQYLVWRGSGSHAQLFSVLTTRHLRPLRWTALSLLPLALLVLPPSDRLAPLTFALMDLRWMWWGFLAIVVARCAGATASWHMSPRSGRAAIVALLLVLPAAFSVVTTPHLRFSGTLHGDEPKYIRYVENFYQGRGFDIANKPLLSEATGPHLLANLGHLARALPQELANLFSDARYVVTGGGAPPLESEEPGSGMVFGGKHPGTVYQLHNPGISFLLLPAYVLDRLVTGSGVGYGGEFPDRMPALHLTLLALFSGYALALFALLRTLEFARWIAVALALAGVIVMPAGAFAFQIYPEIAAGLVLALLVRASIALPGGTSAVMGCGMLCGFLPWLHVRFGIATLVTAAAVLSASGTDLRRRRGFVLGALIPLVLLALYTYRMTGSLIPVATYGSDAPLSLTRTLMGVPALIVDRVWGLLPHAPLFLLAFPGIGAMWRRSPRTTLVILSVTAAVMVPAAGHGFWAGGSTPGRYIVSVAPLLVVFVAESLRVWGHRRVGLAAFIVVTLLSVETAVRYNLHHVKEVGPLVARSFAGWRPNQLFPRLGTETWEATAHDQIVLAMWLMALAILVVIGWRASHNTWAPASAGRPTHPSTWAPASAGAARIRPKPESTNVTLAVRDTALGLLALSALGIIVGLTAPPLDRGWLMPVRDARLAALTQFTRLERCALCYSSASGAVPPTEALGNEVATINLSLAGQPPVSGARAQILVRPRTPDGQFLVSTVRIDFGDGSATAYNRWLGDVDERHVYQAPGDYVVHAWVRGSAAAPLESRMTVHVAPGSRP